jgi:hypothetical protein
MTGVSGFEFLYRPYPYAREPFRLDESDRVGYEGRYFSIPAFGLLLDKRLFTPIASHPVDSPIELYINKDAALSINIEPTLSASGYEQATPHYADYILDLRDLLEDVTALHASDSQYSSDEFFKAHMRRNRAVYDLDNTSASGTSDLNYVHPAPTNTVPVAPSSTIIPGETVELGALQFQDIDMDEVQWQPFTRPTASAVGTSNLPIRPIFPAALPNGSLPTFTDLDKEKYGLLGLDVSSSGGALITGDALVEGTTLKLLTGSGQTGATEGDFVQNIPWARFPAGDQLNLYYETQNSGCVNASGRQAIYDIPAGLSSDNVYMLDVSDAGTSGQLIQTWPGNYHATSGIDPNGIAHRGVHIVDRLLYNLNEVNPNGLPVGRSLINGRRVFGHFVDSAVNSRGVDITGRLGYANGNDVYFYDRVTTPLAGGDSSRFEWATTNNRFYPVNWSIFSTSALEPRPSVFGSAPSTNFDVGDIMAADQVIWRKRYIQWGYIDSIVSPGGDRAAGGNKVAATITYEKHTYRQGTDSEGNFIWIELDPPESPTFTTQQTKYFQNTYSVNNIFSFFFLRKQNYGFVNVNGLVYFQWGEPGSFPLVNRFASISTASKSTQQVPSTSYSSTTYVIGSFPTWQVRLAVTTNNQVTIPNKMSISPASSAVISFDPSLPLEASDVNSFGPAVWDEATGLNYLYFSTFDGSVYFAKMDTSFIITHINQVAPVDGIFGGRSVILDV